MKLENIFKRVQSAFLKGGLCLLFFVGIEAKAITVTQSPTNQSVCPGGTAVFSITATGQPLSYQWFKETTALTGKTSNTLTLTNVVATNAGTYKVKVTSGSSSLTNSATLTVKTPVSASPLTNLARALGANAFFSTVASGTGPFTYVWKKGGSILAGKTASSLTLTNLVLADSATYSVIVSGACSSVTNSATLMVTACFPAVDVMLVIDRSGSMQGQPYHDARRACSNFVNNLNFNPNADKAGLASYNSAATLDQTLTNNIQALRQAINSIPGADGYTSISLGLQTGQSELGSSRHNPQALPVLILLSDGMPTGSDTPSLALAAATQAKNAGSRVFAVGLGNVDHALMAGIASSPADYFYTTNSSELTVLFNAISTVICRPPTNIFVNGPSNATVCAGSSVAFSATASGCAPFTYQWKIGNQTIPGQTTSSLFLTNVTVAQAGIYSIIVSGECKSVTNSATLTVNAPLVVVTPPTNVTACANSPATFTTIATGTGLSYQWYYGTNLLSGQTNNIFTVSNATQLQAGNYSVVVRGTCGASVTNTANLTVNQNVAIVNAPTSQTSVVGSNAVFSVGATGTGLTYQWVFNGQTVGTNSTLILNNLTTNRAGTYCVIVRGQCGNPATNCTTLTIMNLPPVANNDSYTVAEGGTLTRTAANGVLLNDTDPEANPLTAILVAGTSNGSLTLNTNGSFTYIHNGGETRSDGFTYRANDGSLNSGIATVTITITSANDAPVANNDAYTVAEAGTLTRAAANGVLINDTDAETNSLTAILVLGPTNGSLTLNTNGSFTYVHNGTETRTDTFTYKANDGLLDSGIAIVTITITSVNDAPVANNDAYTVAEAGTLTRTAAQGVLINDTDAETNSLRAILVLGPSSGTLNLSTNGSFIYTHNGSETKSDTFTYKANDGLLDSGIATVTITITSVNDAPVANNDSYTVAEAGTLIRTIAQGVLANDTDPETNALTAILVLGPSNGTLSLSTNGSFIYTHNGSETTSDSFTYRANDGLLNSGIATVTITITSMNDAPVANNDSYDINEDNLLTVTAPGVLANDTDAETNPLSSILVNTTTNGTLTLNPNGSFTYLPNANFNGADSFTYRANDGATNSLLATVNILIRSVNDAPSFTAGPSQLVIRNSGARSVPNWATGISPGPANEQSQTVAFQVSNDNAALFLQQPTISPTGTLNFTPAFNAFGRATVTASLKDNGGTVNGGVDTSAPQTFAIIVNSPPTVDIISPTNGSIFIWGQNITLIADAMDPDGTVTNVTFFEGTNKLGEDLAGPYFQVLTNMQPGIYQFTATATDDFGLSATSSVITITVLGSLPFTEAGPKVLNQQTGLIEQRLLVENPTPLTLSAARVLVFNLPSEARVYNASGTNNGIPFVQYNQAIPPGARVEMLIEYYVPSRIPPNTTLVMEVVPTIPAAEVSGVGHKIDRGLQFTGGTFLLEFTSITNRFYSIQYSSDLVTWKAVTPSIRGNGSKIQWIDNGPPKTESLPSIAGKRFYRITLLP